ncbi:Phage-related protein [Xenorhabdus nematophila str. Anatoliense]|nr:Phage-related protein [Xenorhabdus nematophila str. Anatoliense]
MNTEYQFKSTEQRAFEMSFEVRVNGLNQLAQIRAKFFKSANEQLATFIDEMRDKRNEHYADNIRVLAAIFFLARIPKERHGLELSQFSREERINLIKAMNLIKAASPLLPRNLSLPN